jgi:GTP-binding protein
VHRLSRGADAWSIEKQDDGYLVSGEDIEHFVARTDFSNEEAVQRLRDILTKQGIMHELVRRGIEPGEMIFFGNGDSIPY